MSSIEEALLELREAERQKDSAKAFETVRDALANLNDDDRKRLLDMPAVTRLLDDAERRASEQMKPGTVVTDAAGRVIARVPWTWDQMCAEFGTVDWTPMKSTTITINGVDLWVEQGRAVRTPPQFRDVAMESWQADRNILATQREILQRNFGENSVLTYGDGTPA